MFRDLRHFRAGDFRPIHPRGQELPEAARKELKKLEGNWALREGSQLPGARKAEGLARTLTSSSKGNEMLFKLGDETKESHKIAAIDASTTEKCIQISEKSVEPVGFWRG